MIVTVTAIFAVHDKNITVTVIHLGRGDMQKSLIFRWLMSVLCLVLPCNLVICSEAGGVGVKLPVKAKPLGEEGGAQINDVSWKKRLEESIKSMNWEKIFLASSAVFASHLAYVGSHLAFTRLIQPGCFSLADWVNGRYELWEGGRAVLHKGASEDSIASFLRARVFGQEEAVTVLARAMLVDSAGLSTPGKPKGSFLFLGPSGVGKTELAMAVAEYYSGDRNNLIRFDMSEYMENYSAARLIGSPPGYTGFQDGGQLVNAVRRHPRSVILFDEMEKAHPSIYDLFLQILDAGRLTDGRGDEVSFENCIIIMTSNLGAELSKQPKMQSFDLNSASSARDDEKQLKEKIEASLKKFFRLEFINRINEIVLFNRISMETLAAVARKNVDELIKRIAGQGKKLEFTPKSIAMLATESYSDTKGVRNLKDQIYRLVTVPLAMAMLKEPGKKEFAVDYVKDAFVIV